MRTQSTTAGLRWPQRIWSSRYWLQAVSAAWVERFLNSLAVGVPRCEPALVAHSRSLLPATRGSSLLPVSGLARPHAAGSTVGSLRSTTPPGHHRAGSRARIHDLAALVHVSVYRGCGHRIIQRVSSLSVNAVPRWCRHLFAVIVSIIPFPSLRSRPVSLSSVYWACLQSASPHQLVHVIVWLVAWRCLRARGDRPLRHYS